MATSIRIGTTADLTGNSATVQALVDAHEIANPTITAAALQQIGWSLTELEDGSILDVFVDGGCLRDSFHDGATPISFRGVSATKRGTVNYSADGAVFLSDSANTLQFTTADVAGDYTVAVDYRYYPGAPQYASPIFFAAATGTTDGGSGLVASGGLPTLDGVVYTADDTTAANTTQFGDESDAFFVSGMNHNDTIASWSSDNAVAPTVTGWVNGHQELTDSINPLQSPNDLNTITIGAQNTDGATYSGTVEMFGTVASWAVFSRELTDTEHKTVAKALRQLDPREENILIVGDSRSCQISQTDFNVNNWPHILNEKQGRTKRLINVAKSGQQAVTTNIDWDDKCAINAPNGKGIKSTLMYAWFGENDIKAGGATGADIYTDIENIIEKAENAGMRPIVFTDPTTRLAYTGEPSEASYATAAHNVIREDLNVLIREGRHDVYELAQAVGPHDERLWRNPAHFGSLGQQYQADWVAKGGSGNFPPKLSQYVLDQDVTRTSDDTYTDVVLASPDSEGNADWGFSIAPFEEVSFNMVIRANQAVNPKSLKMNFTSPTSCVVHVMGQSYVFDGANNRYSWGDVDFFYALCTGSSNDFMIDVSGTVINDEYPGFVTAQLGQFASSANTLTIYKGSTLTVQRGVAN